MTPTVRVIFVLVLASGLAGPASAQLFRCEGPDGKVIFTDQKSQCPGATPFEPKGEIQSAPSTPLGRPAPSAQPKPAPAAPSRNPLANDAEAAQAQHWQQKKRAAEDEVAAIQRRREHLQQFVSFCNRGGYVTTRDEAGIKKRVNCSQLRTTFNGLEAREAAAKEYLESGLREECRKAGCLPGWIR